VALPWLTNKVLLKLEAANENEENNAIAVNELPSSMGFISDFIIQSFSINSLLNTTILQQLNATV